MADFFVFVSEQYVLVSVLLVLVYLFILNEKRRGGKSLSCNELTRLLNQDQAVLIDIRETADFNSGHIVNAQHIPFNKINDRWEELLPHKDKQIVLVDKMGQHSGSAGAVLRAKDFQVSRLGGGMSEWQGQNLPLVK